MTNKAIQRVRDAREWHKKTFEGSCYMNSDNDECYKAIQTALTVLEAALVEGWQPIESAPKDEKFLAYCPYERNGRSIYVVFSTTYKGNVVDDNGLCRAATNWKPLETQTDKLAQQFIKECEG